jgi:hypothetical protein
MIRSPIKLANLRVEICRDLLPGERKILAETIDEVVDAETISAHELRDGLAAEYLATLWICQRGTGKGGDAKFQLQKLVPDGFPLPLDELFGLVRCDLMLTREQLAAPDNIRRYTDKIASICDRIRTAQRKLVQPVQLGPDDLSAYSELAALCVARGDIRGVKTVLESLTSPQDSRERVLRECTVECIRSQPLAFLDEILQLVTPVEQAMVLRTAVLAQYIKEKREQDRSAWFVTLSGMDSMMYGY